MKIKLKLSRTRKTTSSQIKKRILIVDDDELLARKMSDGLRAIGNYDVRVAHSCDKARVAVRSFHPDFIFFDVDLQDGDGGGLAQELLRLPALQLTKFAFVTGLVARDEVHSKEGTIGGAHFIAKPACTEELVDAIESTMFPGRKLATCGT